MNVEEMREKLLATEEEAMPSMREAFENTSDERLREAWKSYVELHISEQELMSETPQEALDEVPQEAVEIWAGGVLEQLHDEISKNGISGEDLIGIIVMSFCVGKLYERRRLANE